jgi:hypothetical protein
LIHNPFQLFRKFLQKIVSYQASPTYSLGEFPGEITPCKGALELLAPRPKVCRVEDESTILVLKPGIPYEKGELVVF